MRTRLCLPFRPSNAPCRVAEAWLTLALLSFATMVLTGYLLGLRERRYGFPTALMIFTYATVFGLVIDLDRPARGLFKVDQAPMVQLSESIRAELANTPPE